MNAHWCVHTTPMQRLINNHWYHVRGVHKLGRWRVELCQAVEDTTKVSLEPSATTSRGTHSHGAQPPGEEQHYEPLLLEVTSLPLSLNTQCLIHMSSIRRAPKYHAVEQENKYSGGKAMQFTVVYSGKRRYAAVERAWYHAIIPCGILPFHTQYHLNTVRDCCGNSKLAECSEI